ncbi:MAG TPA: DUF3379 family protein [Xanthomonadales bacterium]|nr:DUF3379 family protein [Xanthomonadales bacterium]
MNLSEFKKLLGADPLNRDPDTLRARQSGPEFEAAALEAEAFEDKLRAAVNIARPDDALLDELLAIAEPPKRSYHWMAMAAGVLIAIGVAGVLWNQSLPNKRLDETVAWHYSEDGELLMAMARDDFDSGEARRILAEFELIAEQELQGQIRFMKICEGFNGASAHMIVETDRGLISVIVMPGVHARERLFEFGDMQGYYVAVGDATAAIIGSPEQAVSGYSDLIRNTLIRTS